MEKLRLYRNLGVLEFDIDKPSCSFNVSCHYLNYLKNLTGGKCNIFIEYESNNKTENINSLVNLIDKNIELKYLNDEDEEIELICYVVDVDSNFITVMIEDKYCIINRYKMLEFKFIDSNSRISYHKLFHTDDFVKLSFNDVKEKTKVYTYIPPLFWSFINVVDLRGEITTYAEIINNTNSNLILGNCIEFINSNLNHHKYESISPNDANSISHKVNLNFCNEISPFCSAKFFLSQTKCLDVHNQLILKLDNDCNVIENQICISFGTNDSLPQGNFIICDGNVELTEVYMDSLNDNEAAMVYIDDVFFETSCKQTQNMIVPISININNGIVNYKYNVIKNYEFDVLNQSFENKNLSLVFDFDENPKKVKLYDHLMRQLYIHKLGNTYEHKEFNGTQDKYFISTQEIIENEDAIELLSTKFMDFVLRLDPTLAKRDDVKLYYTEQQKYINNNKENHENLIKAINAIKYVYKGNKE